MTDLEQILDRRIADAVEARVVELARPLYVSQRTVSAVVGGISAREFLAMARAGRFPSRKERRTVVALTADVVEALKGCVRRTRPAATTLEGPIVGPPSEAAALARVGFRRVAP